MLLEINHLKKVYKDVTTVDIEKITVHEKEKSTAFLDQMVQVRQLR